MCVCVFALQVKFEGEDGIDQGGVKKEFFQILTRRMFDPEFGTVSPLPTHSHSHTHTHTLTRTLIHINSRAILTHTRIFIPCVHTHRAACVPVIPVCGCVVSSTVLPPGMFVSDDGRNLWFNGHSFEPAIQFEMIGSVRSPLVFDCFAAVCAFVPASVWHRLLCDVEFVLCVCVLCV